MKNWIYANHSHEVRLHGGVEQYVHDLKHANDKYWITLLLFLSPLVFEGCCSCVQKVSTKIKDRNSKGQQQEPPIQKEES